MKPLIGVSACLMGDPVRYDAGSKKSKWLVESLNEWVRWEKVCPEMAMGLGAPRETLRLKRDRPKGPILLEANHTKTDLTDAAEMVSETLVESIPKDINGFILKNRSPSCGLERVKVYNENNIPFNNGNGFFARAFKNKFPEVPTIDEGRLSNPLLREQFITRVFAHNAITNTKPTTAALQQLHQSYKFVIQAHHEPSLRVLGPLAANSKKEQPEILLKKYKEIFLKALEHPTTVKKRTNVVQHIYGFIKGKITPIEKQSILANIEKYRLGQITYASLLILMQHTIAMHGTTYIEKQIFFSPYPQDLNLLYELPGA